MKIKDRQLMKNQNAIRFPEIERYYEGITERHFKMQNTDIIIGIASFFLTCGTGLAAMLTFPQNTWLFIPTAVCGIVTAFQLSDGGILSIIMSNDEHKMRKYILSNSEEILTEIEKELLQIRPENYSFEEALGIIKRYVFTLNQALLNDTPKDLQDTLLPLYEQTLERFREYYAYRLTDLAIDEALRQTYNDVYTDETKPYLDRMSSVIYEIPEDIDKIEDDKTRHYQRKAWDYANGELKKIFAQSHKDEIEQLRYNTQRLYPIARERKEQNLKSNFEKWFNEQAIPLNKNDRTQCAN